MPCGRDVISRTSSPCTSSPCTWHSCRCAVCSLGFVPFCCPQFLSGDTMKPLLAALILFSSLSMFAADSKPNAAIIGRWVGGTWPLEGKMLDSDYSKAMTVTGVSNCAWSPDHVFVVCDQAIIAEGKPSRDLSVYAFDPESSTYHFYGLSPSGERPRTGEVTISADGARWEYQTTTDIKGCLLYTSDAADEEDSV